MLVSPLRWGLNPSCTSWRCSVSACVLNLLPIPVLDGGHLMYYLWGVTVQKELHHGPHACKRPVLVVLVLMMSIAISNDHACWAMTGPILMSSLLILKNMHSNESILEPRQCHGGFHPIRTVHGQSNHFTVKDIRVEGVAACGAGNRVCSCPSKSVTPTRDDKANASIKALFNLGLFKDVRIEVQGGCWWWLLKSDPP